MQKIGRYILVTLVLVAAAAVIGWMSGKSAGRQEMVIEAIQQNHGHYEIVNEQGGTVFRWGSIPPGCTPPAKKN